MRIWWCQEHKMAAAEAESEEPNDCPAMFLGWRHGNPCRMVPMRLIPDNAETVERIAKGIHSQDDGSYIPEWDKLADWRKEEYREWAAPILAALDGETP